MCFAIQIKTSPARLAEKFGARVDAALAGVSIVDRQALGPSKKDKIVVLEFQGSGLIVKERIWSLTPKFSKTYPCKWSTYNARMTRLDERGTESKIFETPTFRDAFRANQFGLVPLRGALESCYWGFSAGSIVAFQSQDLSEFYAVGLWEDWQDSTTGEVFETCTLLTDHPYSFFVEHGHDRGILVFDQNQAEELLTNTKRTPQESFDFIRKSRIDLNWKAEPIRQLKDGWQKHKLSDAEIETLRLKAFGTFSKYETVKNLISRQ